MADIHWIKLTTDMFSDEKIRLIEKMPEGDAILVVWIKLLTLAGKTNAGGFIFLAENVPYTEEMFATVLDRPVSTIRLALAVFEQFGMVHAHNNGHMAIVNWEKHQNIEGMELVREQNRLRQAKWAAKQKELQPHNVRLTLDNATDSDSDSDSDIVHTSKNEPSAEFMEFWNAYPNKKGRQSAWLAWRTRIKTVTPVVLIACAKNYAEDMKRKATAPDFISQGSTFLGPQKKYEDYVTPANGGNGSTPAPKRRALTADEELFIGCHNGRSPKDKAEFDAWLLSDSYRQITGGQYAEV